MTYSFEDIEKSGLLLYRHLKGSTIQGTFIEGVSDVDEGGVYLEPIDQLLGLGLDFQDEIKDARSDKVWYGLQKYMRMLCSSNPTVLESLFVDQKYVLYEHPIMTELKQHRQEFVTKSCFKPYVAYAASQIEKCMGYNKKCVNPIEKRLGPIDFCYTPNEQGSEPITDWLKFRGLLQDYCGLVSINNMPGCYGVYYDFGWHNSSLDKGDFDRFYRDDKYYAYIQSLLGVPAKSAMLAWFNDHQEPAYYRGIVKCDKDVDDVRCSSVKKAVRPICIMTYNKNGFQTHCRKYKEYQEWVRKRNPQRYISNEGYNFDSKNVAHSFRLISMGLEIAKTGEVHVDRTGRNADFLKDVRNHKYTYDYLITLLKDKKAELEEAIKHSTLPEAIDTEKINQLLIDIRRKYQV